MKRFICHCCVGACNSVLYTYDVDNNSPGLEVIESVGDSCAECVQRQNHPKPNTNFTVPRFGEKTVEKEEDFKEMMEKRKLENRKKSGKGAGRANR